MADDYLNGPEDGDTAEFSTNGDTNGSYSFSAQNSDAREWSWAFEQYLQASGSVVSPAEVKTLQKWSEVRK